jgi:8-oxo-dGTP pyrophosphatase MutT (NUDIX family)
MPHLNDLIDFTVSAYIVYNNKVLLRYHEKYNKWIVPGGHIEKDEGPIEALLREIKEETGLAATIVSTEINNFADDSEDIPVPVFINRHTTNPGHEHIDMVYAARASSDVINPAEGEQSDPNSFRWLTAEEVTSADDITDRVKHHALTILSLVK